MPIRDASADECPDSTPRSQVRELGPLGTRRRSESSTALRKAATASGGQAASVIPLVFSGDDAALVAAVKAGHIAARAALFQRHARFVERVITHVIGFDREFPDILQEVFLSALASIHTLRDARLLEPWLFRVATLTARKVLRRRSRRNWLRLFIDSDEESRWEHENGRNDPSTESRRALGAVYGVLERLPADERIAFALRYIQGMELSEVGEACDVSLATVKRRLRRAEQRFTRAAHKHPELREWLEAGARWGRS